MAGIRTKPRSPLTPIRKLYRCSYVDGLHIATLCNVCDGWEVSDQQDIFKIPIRIPIPSLRIEVLMKGKSKHRLANRLSHQVAEDIKEQTAEGNRTYAEHAKGVEHSLLDLIGVHTHTYE